MTGQLRCALGYYDNMWGSCLPTPTGSHILLFVTNQLCLPRSRHITHFLVFKCISGYFRPDHETEARLVACALHSARPLGANFPRSDFDANISPCTCVPGYTQTGTGVNIVCTPCPAGRYSPFSGATSCLPSPPGEEMNEPETSTPPRSNLYFLSCFCVVVPIGYYIPSLGASAPRLVCVDALYPAAVGCSHGYFLVKNGTNSLLLCLYTLSSFCSLPITVTLVTTIAGYGTSTPGVSPMRVEDTKLMSPQAIAVDTLSNIIIGEESFHIIRLLSTNGNYLKSSYTHASVSPLYRRRILSVCYCQVWSHCSEDTPKLMASLMAIAAMRSSLYRGVSH